MKKSAHYINCSAPICACDTNPNFKNEVIWYPGELVCRDSSARFVRIQAQINRLLSKGKFDQNHPYTAKELEELSRFKKLK